MKFTKFTPEEIAAIADKLEVLQKEVDSIPYEDTEDHHEADVLYEAKKDLGHSIFALRLIARDWWREQGKIP